MSNVGNRAQAAPRGVKGLAWEKAIILSLAVHRPHAEVIVSYTG